MAQMLDGGSESAAEARGAQLMSVFATPVARIPCPFGEAINRPLAAMIQGRADECSKQLGFKTETLDDFTTWPESEARRLSAWVGAAAQALVENITTQSLSSLAGSEDPDSVRVVSRRSWASLYQRGHHHSAHFHPNTAISAIYYVASPFTCELDLVDPRANVEFFDPGITYAHEGRLVRLTCLPGDLVLIPGWLKHSVPEFDDDGMRISIAWNLGYAFSPQVRLTPAGG